MAVVLPTIVRGPTWVSVDNPNPIPGSTGCCILQVFFQGSVNVNLVKFKNYCVYNISIKSKSTDDVPTIKCSCGAKTFPHVPWITGINRKILMPNPNYGDGSQDYVFIHATESQTDWTNLSALLLILRQPSSCWKMFSIKELEIYGWPNEIHAQVATSKHCKETFSCAKPEKENKQENGSEAAAVEEIVLNSDVKNQIEELKDLLKCVGSLRF